MRKIYKIVVINLLTFDLPLRSFARGIAAEVSLENPARESATTRHAQKVRINPPRVLPQVFSLREK
jgi:hypothetical protein